MEACLTPETSVKEIVATLTSKGQVTIPAEVRRHLGIGQGDKLSFVIDDDGRIQVKVPAYPDVASLRERGSGLRENLSFDEMKEVAYEDRLAATYSPDV